MLKKKSGRKASLDRMATDRFDTEDWQKVKAKCTHNAKIMGRLGLRISASVLEVACFHCEGHRFGCIHVFGGAARKRNITWIRTYEPCLVSRNGTASDEPLPVLGAFSPLRRWSRAALLV